MNEIKLTHYEIDEDIIIPEDKFFTLIVENKKFLLRLLVEIKNQTENNSGDFNLLYNEKAQNFEKSVAMISDFTDIDFNSKSISNLLLKNFGEFLGLGEQAMHLTTLESTILNIAEDFRIKSGLNIEYDTKVNANNIAKICSLKIADYGESLLERLCEYVNLICDLKPLKLFILIFGKEFLEDSEISEFYKHCCDKNVRLLFIEAKDSSCRNPDELRLIIDNDLCTIPLGY
jgi:CRISPR type II-A-associated protein Csn2